MRRRSGRRSRIPEARWRGDGGGRKSRIFRILRHGGGDEGGPWIVSAGLRSSREAWWWSWSRYVPGSVQSPRGERSYTLWEELKISSLDKESKPFEVWTDHKNLEALKIPRKLCPKQIRWAQYFRRFNFKLKYIPGGRIC